MGEAKTRAKGVGVCIYCGAVDDLTDEHVVPFGLGGKLVLPLASCKDCAKITAKFEQELLRGHWWPYRQKLNLPTRRPAEQPAHRSATLVRANGSEIAAKLPFDEYPVVVFLEFEKPSILSGTITEDAICGKRALAKFLAPSPRKLIVENEDAYLSQGDQIRYEINFDAQVLARFLAKVAHAFLISVDGFSKFKDYLLPEYILGKKQGIGTYVGGISTNLKIDILPGRGHFRQMVRSQGNFLSVYLQFFVESGDPPPIYEIIVKSAI